MHTSNGTPGGCFKHDTGDIAASFTKDFSRGRVCILEDPGDRASREDVPHLVFSSMSLLFVTSRAVTRWRRAAVVVCERKDDPAASSLQRSICLWHPATSSSSMLICVPSSVQIRSER